MKYLPIKLTPIESRIFQRDFSKVMDRRTFRDFIRKAHLRTFSDGGQICHQGNNFSGLFYVALVNPNYKVSYIKKGNEFFQAKENVWIGVVEYMMYEKEKKIIKQNENSSKPSQINDSEKTNFIKKKYKVKVNWGLDCIVKEREENVQTDDTIYLDEDEPCYVYEFPLGVFFN
jgi:hypothetical protein